MKSCSFGTGYSGRKYWSVVNETLHFWAIASELLINVDESMSPNSSEISFEIFENKKTAIIIENKIEQES